MDDWKDVEFQHCPVALLAIVKFLKSGYTIGYFGRPFQAKGGPQGGAFDKDLDYSRTVLGSGTMVKGLESALTGMKQGSVMQVVIPYGPLSYPSTTIDATHDKVGPKPTVSCISSFGAVVHSPY